MPRESSCGAVVFREDGEREYLLLRYGAGHWGFVKGQVERGESEEETVRRELREETGISCAEVVDGFRERISYFYKRKGETVYKEVVYLLAQVKSDKVELSYEHIGYAWLSYPLALERLTHRNAKNVLTKAQLFLEKRV